MKTPGEWAEEILGHWGGDTEERASLRNRLLVALEELVAEVRRLQGELADYHCNSCDGSAPECRPNFTVRDGKVVPLDR